VAKRAAVATVAAKSADEPMVSFTMSARRSILPALRVMSAVRVWRPGLPGMRVSQ
jgi:hypothetical protein